MVNLYNAYLLLSLVNITDAELKKKRQRALELKQFLLDNKARLISFLHAIRLLQPCKSVLKLQKMVRKLINTKKLNLQVGG